MFHYSTFLFRSCLDHVISVEMVLKWWSCVLRIAFTMVCQHDTQWWNLCRGQAIVPTSSMMDFYVGGGIDYAFLGVGEAGALGTQDDFGLPSDPKFGTSKMGEWYRVVPCGPPHFYSGLWKNGWFTSQTHQHLSFFFDPAVLVDRPMLAATSMSPISRDVFPA